MNGMIGLSGVGSPGHDPRAALRHLIRDVWSCGSSAELVAHRNGSWRLRQLGSRRELRSGTVDDRARTGGSRERIAEVLVEGFDRHYRLFRETSAEAKERFDAAPGPRRSGR